jgi:aerobic-type carbon monoxide dehydrogenase small subunit (CoxS/CutS family)
MITLRINAKIYQMDVYSDSTSLWVMSEDLHLTGTKYGWA